MTKVSSSPPNMHLSCLFLWCMYPVEVTLKLSSYWRWLVWCLSGHIDVGRHLGLALKAPPLIVETGHVNLTSDHVTVGTAGPWTHDVKTGSSLLLRTQSTPGGEWLTLLWFCHGGHGLTSASMVHYGVLADLKNCKRCTGSLNLVAQGYIQFSCKKFVFARFTPDLGGFAPDRLTRGCVPGPLGRHGLQTPMIYSCSCLCHDSTDSSSTA